MTNPIFGQIFQMRFKNQHWFLKNSLFWDGTIFSMCWTIHLCPVFLPRPDTVEQISVGELHSDNGSIHYQLNSISYKPSILRKDWKPKIKLVKYIVSLFKYDSVIVFCCIVAWIQPDISGCQQDFLVVWRWNQLRTF